MAAATKELMWLSEKEEEEVGFDWSERNTNMAAKKESYSVRRTCALPWRVPRLAAPWWQLVRSSSRQHGGPQVVLGGRLADPGVALMPSLRPAAFMSGPDA